MATIRVGAQRPWVLAGIAFGLVSGWAAAQDAGTSEVEALRAQVEELKNLAVRTQSHVMIDVEQHFSNLWFAAKNQQWDLAAFYLREADSHLAWTVRIRPVRNIRGGGSIDLRPFQEGIEKGGFAQLTSAVEHHDIGAFESAYSQTMAQCYACHQASGLGYLQPHIPSVPPSPMMIGAK